MIVDTVALTKALKVIFNQAYKQGKPPSYEAIMERVTSNSDSETYGWLDANPDMREWVGEKRVKSIGDQSYTIENKDFEATIGVDRNELEDDQSGIIKKRIQMLADRAKRYPDKLLSNLVINGITGLAYDSAAYFANRATNDNLLAGSGVTEANLLTDLATARQTMMEFQDSEGLPLGFIGDVVVCPAELEVLFLKIAGSTSAPDESISGVANPWKNIIKAVIVDPNLTDDTDWYLFASSEAIKPLIFQSRKAPRLVALDKDTDEQVFMRKKLIYSVEMRCNAGYGYYEMAVKIVNS
jgi:phage major head subunit gpT-like protein